MGAKNTVSNLNMSIAQRWVDAPSGASQYFSFDAPIGGPAELCGQMVFTDLHVMAEWWRYIPSGHAIPRRMQRSDAVGARKGADFHAVRSDKPLCSRRLAR